MKWYRVVVSYRMQQLTPPRGEGGGFTTTFRNTFQATTRYIKLHATVSWQCHVLQMNYITAVHKLLNALINPRRTCTVRVNVQLKQMEQVARDPLVEGMGKLLDYIQQHLKNKQKHNLS